MLSDSQYQDYPYSLSEMKHCYGEGVHLMSDPYLFTVLSRLCSPECKQPVINQLLNTLYRELVKYVVNHEFPRLSKQLHTRMYPTHSQAEFKGDVIDPSTEVVCVNLARAGTIPSQICFDSFNYILNPEGVRQDHISVNRKVNDSQQVIGTDLGGTKIGGGVDGKFLIIPDPMGATGSTLDTAVKIYQGRGTPKRIVAMHLIVTPEYLARRKRLYPEVQVYALRLDRGLSTEKALTEIPGKLWEQERGLNENQYIIPGGGGLGEVINNSYV